jgi:23S rRNA (uridine2552-2'-O)-methyltransferase
MRQYDKLDSWSLKAQKEGYPARSVYKLKELDEKFNLFKNASRPGTVHKVLDMGAAPGSWSLYLMRKTQRNTLPGLELTAVDLSPLSRQYDQGLFDSPSFHFICGDFTTEDIREAILQQGPFNLIISDAAPATSGNRSIDTLRSAALAETVLSYAETALLPGGALIIKVFQGSGTAELLKQLKTLFETSKSFKPQACRAESFETYYIGLRKRG